MSTYRLTYFGVGGRAEPVRIALHAAGIPFEDHRISFEEFRELREAYRFRCVPVLEIDGQAFTQADAMSRYIGKAAGLYPEDRMQAFYCDEVMGAVDDLTQHLAGTLFLEGDALHEAREKLVAGWIPVFLRGFGELLARGGGEYFAAGSLTMADLKVSGMTGWLGSGVLDHIPQDIVARSAPELVEHQARVGQDPRVAAYYASRG